jgi:hypothetical protein
VGTYLAGGHCNALVFPTPTPIIVIPSPRVASFAVVKNVDSSHVLVANRYGSLFLVDHGAGCILLDIYEGRTVTIAGSSDIFISVGSTLILPNGDTCHVFSGEMVS